MRLNFTIDGRSRSDRAADPADQERRAGPGNALDGKPKFDLTQFDTKAANFHLTVAAAEEVELGGQIGLG